MWIEYCSVKILCQLLNRVLGIYCWLYDTYLTVYIRSKRKCHAPWTHAQILGCYDYLHILDLIHVGSHVLIYFWETWLEKHVTLHSYSLVTSCPELLCTHTHEGWTILFFLTCRISCCSKHVQWFQYWYCFSLVPPSPVARVVLMCSDTRRATISFSLSVHGWGCSSYNIYVCVIWPPCVLYWFVASHSVKGVWCAVHIHF